MNSTLDMTDGCGVSSIPVKPATEKSTERSVVCRHGNKNDSVGHGEAWSGEVGCGKVWQGKGLCIHAYPRFFLPPSECMFIHGKVKCGGDVNKCDWEVE